MKAKRAARVTRARRLAEIESTSSSGWQALARDWREGMEAAKAEAAALTAVMRRLFPAWDDPSWQVWQPPAHPPELLFFGAYDVHLADLPGGLPADEGLRAVTPEVLTLPALRAFPDSAALLLTAEGEGRDEAVAVVRDALFRLLTMMPAGKVRFTLLDPAGLGQNFAAFMQLADHDEALVNSRIWTEAAHIEQRLTDLTAHLENVIQKYLRNRYASIAEYNAQAGEVAEPFRVVVAANFPVNFSEEATRRLVSLARNGPRCGVFTLVTVDTRRPLLPGFDLTDLGANAVRLDWRDGRFHWRDPDFGPHLLRPEAAPADAEADQLLDRAGAAARAAGRVEVPFAFVAPPVEQWWTGDSRRGLSVPLGRAGRSAASICSWARARRSTSSSLARPAPASPPCCTPSSPTWPCSTPPTRWSCTSSTSRRAWSSRRMPPTACRTPASSPSRVSASSA